MSSRIMAAVPRHKWPGWLWLIGPAALVLAFAPPFKFKHKVRTSQGLPAAQFNATTVASAFWHGHLLEAARQGLDLETLLAALGHDRASAERRYGREPAINGPFFYLLKGQGTVSSVDQGGVWLQVQGNAPVRVHLATGPIFGTSLRDASGLLNIGDFSSRQFNALSTALNTLSEAVAEALVGTKPGASVTFAGAGEIVGRDEGHWTVEVAPIEVKVAP